MLHKTAFLIISCDAYSGLWPVHIRCLAEQWPDCPFPKYILTNHLDSGTADVQTLQTGDDRGWSANLKQALEILSKNFDYVLVTFDDLFLVRRVDNRLLDEVLGSFFSMDGQFLQLIRWHNKPQWINQRLGLIKPGSLYRPNCVYALWQIDALDQLLLPEETAWEFERKGSARSDTYDGFYTVLQSVFHYRNTVIRGKIVRKDARHFGLAETGPLQIMTLGNLIRFRFRYWSFRTFLFLIPRKLQVTMVRTKSKLLNNK